MTRGKLLRTIDNARVQEAIRLAETQTSGEICVSVAPLFWGDVRKAAEKAFVRLGMTRTKERNGVLFFVVPSRRKFVVLGDEGIHARVGPEFWPQIVDVMSSKFHEGDFTEGLVLGIEAVGERLAGHFPHQGHTDLDELPNAVDSGE